MALDSPSAMQADAVLEAAQGEVIVVEDLWKTYTMGLEQQVNALCGITLRIRHNEYVAIMGPSGSGKSTLMNLIGCLDTPTRGKYWLNGHDVSELNDDELARSSLRFSLGHTSSAEDVTALVDVIGACVDRSRRASALSGALHGAQGRRA